MAQEKNVRKVLELRVHGVNNTPPAGMLDLPVDDVQEVLGDDLAGFWRPKKPEGAAGRGSRGHVPPGITREAYSWGGLARRSPGGGIGAGSRLLATLITAGWALLLPFGLANVAYWTRRVESWTGRRRTPGAAVVRVFGLCLTALLVVTVCDVSMDLIATQCYRDGSLVCSRLPGLVGGLGAADPAVRLAVFSVVPIAVLLGLWRLSSISRSRYERAFGNAPPPPAAPDTKTATAETAEAEPADTINPVLADDELWKGDVMVTGLARVHLAVGFALVTLCLTWPAVFSSGPDCLRPKTLLSSGCVDQVKGLPGGAWGYGGALVLALVVLLAAVVFAIVGPGRAGQEIAKRAGVLLFASLLTLVLAEASMALARPGLGVTSSLLGVSALPTALLVLMLALVAWALFVRLSPGAGALWAILVLAALGWVVFDGPGGPIPIAVVVVVMVLHLLLLPHDERKWQALAGCAPGAFLGLALVAQNILSSAVVLVVGDWLNGSNGASTLVPKGAGKVGAKTCEVAGGAGACLTVPVPYLLLGAVAVVAAMVLALVAGVAFLRSGSRRDQKSAGADGFERTVDNARRVARLAHRGEKLVGVLAGTALLLTVAATVASAAGWLDRTSGEGPSPLERSLDLSTAAVALLGAAALGALVKGTGNGRRRPLGVVWDLVSFLPRAAHPFAPPCYAERAVPELTDRVAWWLEQPKLVVKGQRRGGDMVVLSAHSLGGVLAVAAIMRQRLQRHEHAHKIRLLTYGSQLRAYFGRFFPELLGPSVLGVPPSLSASLWTRDPWQRQKKEDQERSAEPIADKPADRPVTKPGVSDRTRWRSLWHPTDFIGFPVQSFRVDGDEGIDILADEADETGYLLKVLTHSNYPRTSQYPVALLSLADLPEEPADP